jgi:hypothetical protein
MFKTVDRDDYALTAEAVSYIGDKGRSIECMCVDANFVSARADSSSNIAYCADSATYG